MQVEFDFSASQNYQLVAGVDEVGRGPLVGNVVAAAVILDPSKPIEGLRDSKKLSEKKRILLEAEIKQKALCWCVAVASPEEIDQINILQASFLAMKRAVEGLTLQPEFCYVDGNKLPELTMPAEAIVKGDDRVPAISAASILAKQARDQEMYDLAKLYPDYQFNKHKGYPTAAHLDIIQKLGVLPQYRKSFKPVQRILEQISHG
ncbi:ribonuclease HII [Catenovulum agarivorans DS-2]|uniref:Ribonuclease HII n=1 Tax=Catenovulum agarivorans DS-2 TaxID=1328313 RepID=W7R127_9ALTE|nr:ribonuclease HII [Catenovulum agarivorans]EWH11305.1 ribonuclease HII [Catenovulum agarivorans DS-2]